MALLLATSTAIYRFGGCLDDPVERLATFEKAELGYLRSVAAARVRAREVVLAVGAQRGVYLASLDGDVRTRAYRLPKSRRGRRGVNSVLLCGDRVFAAHSAYGVAMWALDSPHDARPVFDVKSDGARSVRALRQLDDGFVLFAAGRRLLGFDPGEVAPRAHVVASAPHEISAFECRDGEWFAGMSDGRLVRWPRRQGVAEEMRGSASHAIYGLRTAGVGGAVYAIAGMRESYALAIRSDGAQEAEFRAPWPVRWVEADGERVYAAEDAGRRLSVWSWAEPREPLGHVAFDERIEMIRVTDYFGDSSLASS